MKTFVVYEVWTASRVIEARNEEDAVEIGEPKPREGLNLCNWHVVPVEPPAIVDQTTEVLRMTLAERE